MALIKINNRSSENTAIHGRRNLIINGAMNVWQRGTTQLTVGGYMVDRHQASIGTVTITQDQSTDVPSGQGFNHSWKVANTGTTTSTGAYIAIQTGLEAQDIKNSGWNYTDPSSKITLSFWAKSNTAGTYQCGVRSADGTAYNITSEYTLSANTWKKITVSYPGKSDLAFDSDSALGFTVFPMIELGSNYTAGSVNDVWTAHSGSTQTPDKTSSWMSTTSADFYVTGVQLEVGDIATPFEHRSYGEELSLCSRYYHTSFSGETTIGGSHPANYAGKVFSWCDQYGSSPDRVAFNYQWPVQMRDIPTVTMYGNAWTSGRVSRYNGGATEHTIDYASGVSRNGLGGYYDVAAGATGDFVVAYVEANAEF